MIASVIGTILMVFFLVLLAVVLVVVVISLGFGGWAVIYRLLPVPQVPFSYTVRNLTLRWKNSAITIVAFMVVIALLTGMLAFVGGMYQLTGSSGHPLNVILLADGATDEAFSSLPAYADFNLLPMDIQTAIARTADDRDFLCSKEVYVIVNQPIPNAPKGGKQRRFIQMRGIYDPLISAEVHALELAKGHWWSSGGAQKVKLTADGRTVSWLPPGAKGPLAVTPAAGAVVKDHDAYEVVLGDGIAKELANDRPDKAPVKPGDVFDIGGYKWIVTGIMAAGNSTFSSEVWAKDTTVGPNFGKGNIYTTLVARAKGSEGVARAVVQAFKDAEQISFAAQLETDYYAKLSETNKQFLFAIMIIAAVMALGGALGVMNTMFAAISQRQKDIGVLRLLGFTRGQILMSFLFESLLIAVVGGVLGLALGFLADGQSTISTISSGQGGKTVLLQMVVSGWVIAVSVLLTLIMGSVGGLVPALSAMRLKPLESLR